MLYRLYLDESGDHTTSNEYTIGKRYLGIICVIFSQHGDQKFHTELATFKGKHFPSAPVPLILHRVDIVQKRGPFSALLDEDKCRNFDEDLKFLMKASSYRLIAVVIDKQSHSKKTYRSLTHPYHYCLQAVFERYCGFLRVFGGKGDVMAESRGATEDKALKEAYRDVYKYGTRFLSKEIVQSTLTSKEIKIKKKDQDEAGLQLADLFAHPITRDVLFAHGRIKSRESPFADEIARIVEPKYNHASNGTINGYGRIILT